MESPFLTTTCRIATVPFYNAWPLTRFLHEEIPGSVLTGWYPSAMRAGLNSGELDLALMPVAELPYVPKAEILGTGCIGCRGPVRSVLLISRVPIQNIRQIALDVASRSSVTLAGVILGKFYGVNPERIPLDFNAALNECPADAMVVIGDRALAFEPGDHWEYRYDLGELWKEKTGLPFVFAAWIGKMDENRFAARDWESLAVCLDRARDRGVRSVEQIVQEREKQAGSEGPALLVEPAVLIDYLRNAIHYHMEMEERKGLCYFLELAAST